MTQRDLFLTKLLELAKKDKDVILIAPDMGAPTIDRWKAELPEQFFSVGIAEQNAINVASGFSNRGKKVYVYFMACWSARCFEQIRYSCSIGNNPITIIGCGVGLSYAPAGPAHNPTDDIAYMRSICDIEIYSPATNQLVEKLVDYTYNHRRLVYVRLERTYDSSLDELYKSKISNETLKNGAIKLFDDNFNVCIVSSGYMMSRCVQVSKKVKCDVVDLFKIKPLNEKYFIDIVKDYDIIVNVEEQTANGGGFCATICQTLMESKVYKKVINIQLPEGYIFENGSRDQLLDKYDLSVNNIWEKIQTEINRQY
jgi:transketolase